MREYTKTEESLHLPSGVNQSLYLVTENGDVTVLHTQSSENLLFIRYSVSRAGELDYKNRFLCWSETTQLLSGKLDVTSKSLTDVITVVREGEPGKLGIC